MLWLVIITPAPAVIEIPVTEAVVPVDDNVFIILLSIVSEVDKFELVSAITLPPVPDDTRFVSVFPDMDNVEGVPVFPMVNPVIAAFPKILFTVLFVTEELPANPVTTIPVIAPATFRLIFLIVFPEKVTTAPDVELVIPVKTPVPIRVKELTSLLFILATVANVVVFEIPIIAPVPVLLIAITLLPVIEKVALPAEFRIPFKTDATVLFTVAFCTVFPVMEIVPVAALLIPFKVQMVVVVALPTDMELEVNTSALPIIFEAIV